MEKEQDLYRAKPVFPVGLGMLHIGSWACHFRAPALILSTV